MPPSQRGILLLAHGSIVAGVEHELEAIAAVLRKQTDVDVVQIGFLDYTEPKIPEAIARMALAGVGVLLVMPYFLSAGYLLKKSLRLVGEEVAKYPQMTLHTAEHLGGHPRLVDVMIDRIEDARAKLD